MAFYIVIAWQNHDIADQQASAEAAELVDLYRHTDALPQQQQDRVRSLVRDYTSEVIDREWPMMADGGTSPRGDALLASLRQATRTSDPTVTQAVDRNLRTITDNRRARLEQAANQGGWLQLLLYGSFVSGAVTVVYPVLMGLGSGARHITVMALLAAALGVVARVEIGTLVPVHRNDLRRPATSSPKEDQQAAGAREGSPRSQCRPSTSSSPEAGSGTASPFLAAMFSQVRGISA